MDHDIRTPDKNTFLTYMDSGFGAKPVESGFPLMMDPKVYTASDAEVAEDFTSNSASSVSEIIEGYKVSDKPLGTIKPVRVITIGAGASGINMLYQAKHYLQNAEFIAYEKNSGVGGTWFENRYPGCKCDIRK